ncbi:MAG: hypothetical protein P1P88_02490 [Bacteroidales bacterium]|nr:hypothetical protein [Bacteroidales bacterium]
MLKEIFEIENCKSAIIKNEICYFLKENKLYSVVVGRNKIEEIVETPCCERLLTSNNQIYVLDDLNQIILEIDKNGNISNVRDSLKSIRVNLAAKDCLVIYVKKPERKRGLYNTLKNEISFLSEDFAASYVFEDYAINCDSDIVLYSPKTGKTLKKINTSEFLGDNEKIEKVLGFFKDYILIVLSSGGLMAINVVNPETRHIWTVLVGANKEDVSSEKSLGNFSVRSAKLSIDKSILLGFEYDVYWEVDLNTFSLNSFALQEDFQKYGVTGCWSNTVLKDNLVFFFSDQKYQENFKLVCFDCIQKKIISTWSVKMNNDLIGFDINGPEIFGNYLLLKQQNQTVHILEIKNPP